MASAVDYAWPERTRGRSPVGLDGDFRPQAGRSRGGPAPDDRGRGMLFVERTRYPSGHGLGAAPEHPDLAALGQAQREAASAAGKRERHAVLAQLATLVAMEEELHLVRAARLERVIDHDAPRRLVEIDATPVR